MNLKEIRRIESEDKTFIIVFLGDSETGYRLELTWIADRQEAYELGDNESHFAFYTENFEAAHNLHESMGCICYENTAMGLYFISDPDGYWIEILPDR